MGMSVAKLGGEGGALCFETALASWDCHNQRPQTRWLKIIGIYCLIAREAKSLKSGYSKDHTPSKRSKEESSLACPSFLWLQTFLGCGVSLHPLPLSSITFSSLSVLSFSVSL